MANKKEHPLIITVPGNGDDRFWRAFIEVALDYEWRLLDLHTYNRVLPDDMSPEGLVGSDFANDPLIHELKIRGCKCVRAAKYPHPLDKELPAVCPDRDIAGRMAAEHFATRGYKHVAQVVSVPRANPDNMSDVFAEESAKRGMTVHNLERRSGDGVHTLNDTLRDWLHELPKPVAILAYHEFLASRICLVAKQEDLLIPHEIAVLTIAESYRCEMAPVPLSAIEFDTARQGREAAYLLKRMLDGETVKSVMVPPARIIQRQSTDVLAVQDITVAKALTYIWEHYDWPLTVDDVALEVNVSRSTLDRRFRRHLKRGVNAEIRRKRLERCCELLKTTSMNVDELVKACGFKYRAYLHRAFLKEFGMTLMQYRRDHTEH